MTALRWEDTKSRWIATTNRNDTIEARFVSMSAGPLHRLKLPGIPGIENFKGHSFHTSRWDYDYTGGDTFGAPLEKLKDKRVAIIGTGATSVLSLPMNTPSSITVVFLFTPS